MNQAANTLAAVMIVTEAGATLVEVTHKGRTWTLDESQHGGTYLGAVRYLGIDMPQDYKVSLLPTSALFTW